MKAINIIAVALLVAFVPGAQGQGRSEIYERVFADGAPGPYNPQEPDGQDRMGRNHASATFAQLGAKGAG